MMQRILQAAGRAASYVWQLPLRYTVSAVVLIVAGAIAVHYATRAAPAPTVAEVSHVSLATVASLASQTTPLQLVGNVTSQSKATILAQSSGEVVRLNVSMGDSVSAGEVIGQFDNASQQAAVVQAEGTYESAQAALQKLTSTTAANSSISSASASTAVQNAQRALYNSLTSAYASTDDAIHTKADALFDSVGASPALKPFTVPDSQLVLNIENERSALNATFTDMFTHAHGTGDVNADTAAVLSDATTARVFLDALIQALNSAVPNPTITASDISTYQTSLASARTEVISAISSITTARTTYDSALASAQSAANNASGGTESDLAAAKAALKSAQGTLDAAQANLAKTIIRSPISGVIVSLPIAQGDYVSTYSPIAQVSNPSALYVDAQVTPDEAKTIHEGTKAVVDGNVPGVVTFVARALDPQTGKIEVKVGLNGDTSALTDGEVVSLQLSRAAATTSATSTTLTIPINAAKITPSGPQVFTVSASSTLVGHPITFGTILGDRVNVTSGLTSDMTIVTDARGLSDGQTVAVDH